jgi:hypothetical protein
MGRPAGGRPPISSASRFERRIAIRADGDGHGPGERTILGSLTG